MRLYVCCQGCVNAHGLCHRAPCIYLPEYVLATALDAPNDQSEEIQFIMQLDYFFHIPLRDDSSVRLLLWQLLLPLVLQLLLLDVKKVNCMLIPTAVVVASLLCNSPFPLSRSFLPFFDPIAYTRITRLCNAMRQLRLSFAQRYARTAFNIEVCPWNRAIPKLKLLLIRRVWRSCSCRCHCRCICNCNCSCILGKLLALHRHAYFICR